GVASVTDITNAEISYMQSLAGFATDGDVSFHISFDTTVGGGDYSGLSHSGSGVGVDDSQFSDSPTTQAIGTGTFDQDDDGTVDTYVLDISGVEADLISAINSGNPFSIILGASSGGTAATYAGIESNNFVGNGGSEPDSKMTNLSLTAVPEPSTYAAVLGLLGLAIVALRRRRR
ncbi:MAG: PEP-CTERM sorting domain-containing protein, partial [Verrucomicrobia bacterium]|nr:PEP-CTERM sorting domain-containing protein [Verrucomicrobiota bacterium]